MGICNRVVWSLKLTESFSDLSSYLLQEHFIFVLVVCFNQVKSVLSFQYHPVHLYSLAVHWRSGNLQLVLSEMQGKRWGEGKGIGRQISRFRFGWKLLLLGWFLPQMSWLWGQGGAVLGGVYLEIRSWSNKTQQPQVLSCGSLFEDNL